MTPGQGPDSQNADPAKAALAIADGLYIRKLFDLAVPEYEKYLGQFPSDSGRPSAMYRLADCYANLGQEQPALNTYRLLVDEVGIRRICRQRGVPARFARVRQEELSGSISVVRKGIRQREIT